MRRPGSAPTGGWPSPREPDLRGSDYSPRCDGAPALLAHEGVAKRVCGRRGPELYDVLATARPPRRRGTAGPKAVSSALERLRLPGQIGGLSLGSPQRWTARHVETVPTTAQTRQTSPVPAGTRPRKTCRGSGGTGFLPLARHDPSSANPSKHGRNGRSRCRPQRRGGRALSGRPAMCHLNAPTRHISTPAPGKPEPNRRFLLSVTVGAGLIGSLRNAVPWPFSWRTSGPLRDRKGLLS